jgi:hypothetical protein
LIRTLQASVAGAHLRCIFEILEGRTVRRFVGDNEYTSPTIITTCAACHRCSEQVSPHRMLSHLYDTGYDWPDSCSVAGTERWNCIIRHVPSRFSRTFVKRHGSATRWLSTVADICTFAADQATFSAAERRSHSIVISMSFAC